MPTLGWIGKDKVLNHHLDVTFRTLKRIAVYGNAESATENRIIHGDNLEALKALLPEYEGRVQCIYIDPPYNTGNENWVYNDNVSDPRLKKWLGQVVGKEGEDLSRHDKWLCMMYPRLKLLHRLLSEDGTIWISIDDNEQANLRLMMDEIFGEGNFVANVIWQKVFSPKNSAMYFSEDHDYIMVYARKKSFWRPRLLARSEGQNDRYNNQDDDPRGPWTSGDLSARNFYGEGTYPIVSPGGRTIDGPPKGTYWRFSKENFLGVDRDKRIWWGKDGNGVPRLKRFLSEVKQGLVPQTLWTYSEVGHTQDAKKELLSILEFETSADVFITPKPTRLIERILQIATDKDAIVLDSFAGSGTTGHAVLKQNKTDGGNRKYILVEMEDYAETLTAERMRRVIAGYGGAERHVEGLGGGFGYYEPGPELFLEDSSLNPDVDVQSVRAYVWHAETGGYLPENKDSANRDFLGSLEGISYYLCYDPNGSTALDYRFLKAVDRTDSAYVVYADSCALSPEFLERHSIAYRKLPRDIPRI